MCHRQGSCLAAVPRYDGLRYMAQTKETADAQVLTPQGPGQTSWRRVVEQGPERQSCWAKHSICTRGWQARSQPSLNQHHTPQDALTFGFASKQQAKPEFTLAHAYIQQKKHELCWLRDNERCRHDCTWEQDSWSRKLEAARAEAASSADRSACDFSRRCTPSRICDLCMTLHMMQRNRRQQRRSSGGHLEQAALSAVAGTILYGSSLVTTAAQ